MEIDKILEEIREEKRKYELEKKEQEDKILKEWRKKVSKKYKRENEKKDKLFKQKMLSYHCEMLKWITEFINNNQEEWEKKNEDQELYAMAELYKWNRMKRIQKIERIKKDWNKEKIEINEKEAPEIKVPVNAWSVLRTKEPVTEGFNTSVNNLELPTDPMLEQDFSSGQVWRTKEPVTVGFNISGNKLELPADPMLKQDFSSGKNIVLENRK